jgi:hypothetical protein
MTFAIVNVLPLPVTPISVWNLLPARRPSTSRSIACGWSPAGLNSVFNLTILIVLHFNCGLRKFHGKFVID